MSSPDIAQTRQSPCQGHAKPRPAHVNSSPRPSGPAQASNRTGLGWREPRKSLAYGWAGPVLGWRGMVSLRWLWPGLGWLGPAYNIGKIESSVHAYNTGYIDASLHAKKTRCRSLYDCL
jgi:hypothetical protein